MREMHKWKDKVELSLDNRQIFFLFFGLSIVGCFVFALGVMVGRRVDFGSTGEVAALASDGLALLSEDGQAEGEDTPAAALSFQEGLAEPATAGLPPTRDPSTPPADAQAEAEPAKADKAAKADKGKNPGAGADADAVLAKAAAPGKATAPEPKTASGDRKFTLQMKAFSRPEEAEAFAAPLRANGHDIRVEPHEVKGRIWHRVRMGEFTTWEDGIAAKETFEKREKVIAYVVKI